MRSRAFTLFEMLIALAMFILAVGGLATALNKVFSANNTMRRDTEIREQIESWADQAMALPIETLQAGMESEPDSTGAVYSVAAEPAELKNINDEELPGLWWVTVRARWKDGTEPQEWTEKFLRFQQ